MPRPRLRRVGRSLFVATVVLCATVGFGFSGGDYAGLEGFARAAERWQRNPEFRAVAAEYSVRGSEAMRSRPFAVPAVRLIMGIRSIPGLPKAYAVSPTSRLHYENFSRGPLSAYLHLSGEQDVPSHLTALEELGAKAGCTDADLRGWLDARQMDFPIVRDRGAVQSLGTLVADTDPARPFAVRSNIPDLLNPHIAGVASELGVPTDPKQMTPDQQQAVLDRLDGYVKRHDPELWRTKQVNDFLAGIWAQVYGPVYRTVLTPFLIAHTACRIVLVLLLAWVIARLLYARRCAARASVGPAMNPAADEPPGSQDVSRPSQLPSPS